MKSMLLLFRILLLLFLFTTFQNSFTQNIGIGITNPTKGKLEVYGAVGATSAIFGGDGAGISLERNWPSIGFNQYNNGQPRVLAPGNAFVQYLDMNSGSMCLDSYTQATSANSLAQGQTRRLTIRQNGNVSVYNSEANASLFVGPSNTGLTAARFRGTQYNSAFAERVAGQTTEHTTINAGKNGSNVYINDQGLGNVLLGGSGTLVGINNDPTISVLDIRQIGGRGLKLVAPNFSYNNWGFTVNHVLNETKSDLWVYYNEGYKGSFFSVDGLYYPASDRRVKTDIQFMPSVLHRVLALQPVSYQMKYHNEGHVQSIGFLAQQVKPLFPDLVEVIEGEEHGYKGITDLHSMNYDGIGPIAIKAIQEQQQKIQALQEKNAVLRQRIEAAERALSSRQ